MQHNNDHKPACSTVNAAMPDEVTCPSCGEIFEMWSDETETDCPGCGVAVRR